MLSESAGPLRSSALSTHESSPACLNTIPLGAAVIHTSVRNGSSETAADTSTAVTIGSLLTAFRHRQHNETKRLRTTSQRVKEIHSRKMGGHQLTCVGRCHRCQSALMSVKPTAIYPLEWGARRVSSNASNTVISHLPRLLGVLNYKLAI